eukprot:SAG31_NODE_8585_length_1425_cov_1.552036_1_plen_62_part_00
MPVRLLPGGGIFVAAAALAASRVDLIDGAGNEPEHFLATCNWDLGQDMSSVQLGYECWCGG